MRLTLAIHPITEMRFGDSTALAGTLLSISADELRRLLLEDDRLDSAEVEIVQPGKACRFGSVFDVVEPRAKQRGDGSDFPGVLGRMALAGRGTTHVLRGAAVSVLGDGVGGALIEMAGEAADYTPFSRLCHVVLILEPRSELPRHVQLNARANAGVKAAAYLARCSLELPPAETEVFESQGPLESRGGGRPRMVYVGQVHSRQRVAEVDEQIIYGHNTTGMVPVVLHPNEWLDGAVLAGNAGGNIVTYLHQNHPIVSELYRWHNEGKIAFVGTIATVAGSNNFDRDLNCVISSELTKWNLGADGVVLSKAGGGAPHADMGYTAFLCEKMGIRTVVQVGPPNSAPEQTVESATLFNYPEVDAVVFNSGGAYRMFQAAPVERAIGPSAESVEALFGLKQFPATRVCGITNQQGAQRLRSFVY